jgi:DNA topoisomerase I
MEPAESANQAKKNIVQAVKRVALHLGNKPSTCRKYYIHPAILEAYMDGSLMPVMKRVMRRKKEAQPYELSSLEHAVLAVMKKFSGVAVWDAC